MCQEAVDERVLLLLFSWRNGNVKLCWGHKLTPVLALAQGSSASVKQTPHLPYSQMNAVLRSQNMTFFIPYCPKSVCPSPGRNLGWGVEVDSIYTLWPRKCRLLAAASSKRHLSASAHMMEHCILLGEQLIWMIRVLSKHNSRGKKKITVWVKLLLAGGRH